MAKSLGPTAEFFRRKGEWRNQLRHAAPSANNEIYAPSQSQSHFTASAFHSHSELSTFRRTIVQYLTTTETSFWDSN
ncbi:hypothetical protein DM860_007533 [Cuscuta australis]|uniref:Uncharacterized protein n=1 Tax=Cuscuta australis TaxID=267555 RepID=A0A328E497_9ASTE|nr:hypothetical protein DM860_007533 [Cuscuta australis]